MKTTFPKLAQLLAGELAHVHPLPGLRNLVAPATAEVLENVCPQEELTLPTTYDVLRATYLSRAVPLVAGGHPDPHHLTRFVYMLDDAVAGGCLEYGVLAAPFQLDLTPTQVALVCYGFTRHLQDHKDFGALNDRFLVAQQEGDRRRAGARGPGGRFYHTDGSPVNPYNALLTVTAGEVGEILPSELPLLWTVNGAPVQIHFGSNSHLGVTRRLTLPTEEDVTLRVQVTGYQPAEQVVNLAPDQQILCNFELFKLQA